MKTSELPALAELRESLREAAARDIAARKPRRWRRRGIALFAVVLVGGAAAAGAADLISSGEPVNDRRGSDPRYDSSGQLQLAVTAADKPLPWGVQTYTSPEGRACALAGRVRGVQLGLLDAKGVFHRYPEGRSGACASPGRDAFIAGLRRDGKTALFGRAAREGATVHVVIDGKDYATPAGRDGAFIFLFKGSVVPSGFRSG